MYMIITEKGLPTKCEYCDCDLKWDGVDLVCTNPYCLKIGYESVKAWCMNVAPIDGLGWKTIDKLLHQLISDFNIDSVKKLYNVANSFTRFSTDKPNSEKGLVNQMLDKLAYGKDVTLSQFILGLNIPGIGKISAKDFENWDKTDIINDILNKNELAFTDLAFIFQNKNVANDLLTEYNNYFCECYNLVKSHLMINNKDIVKDSFNNNVKEKGQVVITGKLSMKRADFENILKQNGWFVVSKVSKDVRYLITNTPDSNTVKNREADVLGIEKINEENFIKIMED